MAWILRHPVWTLTLSLAVTILAFLATTRLAIQTNFVDLLPEDDPVVHEVRQLERVVGGSSFVVLTVETDAAELVPAFFHGVAKQLANHPDINYIDYQPPVDFFRRSALLYLSRDELADLVHRTRRFIDRQKLRSVAVDLSTPDDDTFSLADIETKYPHFLNTRRLYQSTDGRLFVMLIKPREHATNTQFTKRLIADIDRAIGAAKPWSSALLQVRLTGPYVKALTQNAIVLADAKRISLLSMTIMLAFLLAYFRQKRAVVIIGVPLLMSTVWAIGTAY
ncbi:MAG: MMPL family transporter, partial [Deltaproteobacteria bacterium]|nr:MMPL family transporter [Deltaproteobacteria bacterium]